MQKAEANKLIQTTFENPFDTERYRLFVKNMLKDGYKEKSFVQTGNLIYDSFSDSVSKLERIGQYQDENGNLIELLVVQLKRQHSVEWARTTQRNFIRRYLNGGRGGVLRDAALVAFYTEGSEDWRFSLIRMQYSIEKKRDELTPAKRFSFLVGINERSHTAKKQLAELLTGDQAPTLTELEKAFNIEKVTKEFFEKYKELFLRVSETIGKQFAKNKELKAQLAEKHIDHVTFTKKLLGQITFLYFLQKKGWLGVHKDGKWGDGDKQYLRTLLTKAVGAKEEFFSDYLQYLFYEALADERRGSADPAYYKRLDCKIPFLNGGLFEADYDWKEIQTKLPNDLFTNSTITKEGDIGDGILDIFDRYNFTVKEDEPLEKEVAVDPEMLGKVFENLLEIKDRKSKGAYYTPREIVHYMCQESLINYLDSTINSGPVTYAKIGDKQSALFGNNTRKGQLKMEQKVELDIIVPRKDIEQFIREGSAALQNDLLVEKAGKETATYKSQMPESVRTNASALDKALKNIRICDPAIGSGAFPVGMMNEIVKAREVLTTYYPDNKRRNRSPYDFKRHCIQECIYGVDIDHSAIDIAKLRLWLSLVVDEQDLSTVKPLPNLDYKIVEGNSLIGLPPGGVLNDEAEKELEGLKVEFFDETNNQRKKILRKKIDKVIEKQLHTANEFLDYELTFDFRLFFGEIFHEKGGFDVVIGNPPYGGDIEKKHIKIIRKKVSDTKNLNTAALFIDFAKNYWINKNGILSFIVPKSLLFADRWFGLVKALLGKVPFIVDVEKAFEKVKLEQVVFLYRENLHTDHYVARKFLNDSFVSSTLIPNILVSKYKAWICDVSLEEILIADKVIREDTEFMSGIMDTKRGVGMQRHLKQTGEFTVIAGKNITQYGVTGMKGFVSQHVLEKNKKKIEFMRQPKIMVQRLVAHIQNPHPHMKVIASLDKEGIILNVDTVENIVLKDKKYPYEYLLALLNSKFISWYCYRFIFCSAIRTVDFDNYYVGKIPIRIGNSLYRSGIVTAVERIGSPINKNLLQPENFDQIKHQIDVMIYHLYNLTYKEATVIDPALKREDFEKYKL